MSGRNPILWIARSALWPTLVLLAAVSAAGCFGREHWVLSNLSQFRPQLAVAPLMLVPAAALLTRRRAILVGTALVLAVFNAAWVAPCFPGRVQGGGDADASVSVLLWNTWRKNSDFERGLDLIRDSEADIVLLQETNAKVQQAVARLEDSYRITYSGDDIALVRTEAPHRVFVPPGTPFKAFLLEVHIGKDGFALLSTHLMAPLSAKAMERRTRQLAGLAELVVGSSGPVVVMGDLNATPWSHELRDLRRDAGLHDSLAGRGLQGTWPFHNALTSILRIPLDHCLFTDGVRVIERSVGDPSGSNHRPLFVRLILAD